jgi:chitinase
MALMGQAVSAAVVPKVEPNDILSTSRIQAQNVDASFTRGFQYGVAKSETWNWVSIQAAGNGTDDFYSFTVPAGGAQVILDIDFTEGQLSSYLRLYHTSRSQMGTASTGSGGDPGSLQGESDRPLNDGWIQRTGTLALPAGIHYVGVRGNGNTPVATGQAYTLKISMLPNIHPLVADVGGDFSVNEGDTVFLGVSGGSGSATPDYSWTQIGGTSVNLAVADTLSTAFVAPDVSIGGETLSFLLTVGSGTSTATETVNVTVVNVNHPPVADAGEDQTVAERAPVTLYGENSFDIDNDPVTYAWVQTGGPPVVLTGAEGPNPNFEAPYVGVGGEPGVVATLVFKLFVDDGFPMDAPAPGYAFENVIDTVTVFVTNTNNLPVADAGTDQTVNENSAVVLDGTASFDPDGDSLKYSWVQKPGGIPVILTGADTATPSFLAPAVCGTTSLYFTLTVDDGYGGSDSASITVNVLDSASPPLVGAARPTVSELWPPNHRMVPVGITGVSDEDFGVVISITGVTQDEPTNGTGDGDTPIDAVILPDGTVLIRSERSGKGNGRVYKIHFTATNNSGGASGTVRVAVPYNKKMAAVDGDGLFDSTQ